MCRRSSISSASSALRACAVVGALVGKAARFFAASSVGGDEFAVAHAVSCRPGSGWPFRWLDVCVGINIIARMSKRPDPPYEITHQIRDRCLCLHAQRAARALGRRFDAAFRPLGLTNGQFSLLMALNRPEPPTIGAVAALLAMDRTTLTAALKPLERRGLIVVTPDDDDRRSRRLALTEEGRAVLSAGGRGLAVDARRARRASRRRGGPQGRAAPSAGAAAAGRDLPAVLRPGSGSGCAAARGGCADWRCHGHARPPPDPDPGAPAQAGAWTFSALFFLESVARAALRHRAAADRLRALRRARRRSASSTPRCRWRRSASASRSPCWCGG